MSTTSQTFALTFSQTNALQPDRTTPVDLITYTDSNAVMVAEGAVVVPAAGMTLTLPPGWSKVNQVLIVNTDAASYLNLAQGTLARVLPTLGGMYQESAAYVSGTAVPPIAGQTVSTVYGTWVLRPVSASGAVGSLTATAYIWLTGF